MDKLDIGAGSTAEDGWTAWDIKDGNHADDLASVETATVSEIRASHVLEHLPMQRTMPALQEWFRVLKPGGRLFVAVPDFARVVAAMLSGSADPNLERYLMGGQTDEHDFHHALFTVAKLEAMLDMAGFERIRQVGSEGMNCSRHWCSMNLEAFKGIS